MPRKKTYFTSTDQFCGAGGSSQATRENEIEVVLALNHWQLAIDTHQTNFPDTIHDCTDISACDPRRYPSTDFLTTSPECTTHSPGKGLKAVKAQMDLFKMGKLDPAVERSRATMWDVPRFAEYHKYNIIVVENVVEAVSKWVPFQAWLHAMRLLGYNHKIKFLNSQHFFPTPQSRDRIYVVFWKKGNPEPNLDYTPKAYCTSCSKDVDSIQIFKKGKTFGKYRTQYNYHCPTCTNIVEPYYYAAFNAIDWSIPGKRIGDRKIPLVENTERRIKTGLDRYGMNPIIIQSRSGEFKEGFGVHPFFVKADNTSAPDMIRDGNEVLPTQATWQTYGVAVPWIIEMNKTGECKPASLPTSSFTAGGINHALMLSSLIVNNKGQSNSKPITHALDGQTTISHHGLLTREATASFLHYYYGSGSQSSDMTDVIGSVSTKDRFLKVDFPVDKPKYEDCHYRMLRAKEVGAAMAFERDYIVLGDEKSKVKQYGNAVTPPPMKWLLQQCKESLS